MPDTSAKPVADTEIVALFSILDANAIDAVMLAVSGGTDSLALLHLYARYRLLNPSAPRAIVVTVDHGWRPEAAAEAAFVAAEAKSLGLPHETLVWTGEKPATGRQQAARDARYRLFAGRLAREEASRPAVLTAHTADDQAETLLMRLARGSGVDGLSAMRPVRPLDLQSNALLIRPLLQVPRARLAATLAEAGVKPVEDPSNADPAFERVRIRTALHSLAPLGLTPAALARSAARLKRANDALDDAAHALEQRVATILPGLSTSMDAAGFAAAPEELRIRLLARALRRQGGRHRPAELAETESLASAVLDTGQGGATLGGCTVQWRSGSIAIFRELGRHGLPECELSPGAVMTWDDRFEIALAAAAPGPLEVRSLPPASWPRVKPLFLGLPAGVALTLPSLWRGDRLVALPSPSIATPAPDTQHMPCIPPPAESDGTGMEPPEFDAAEASMKPLER